MKSKKAKILVACNMDPNSNPRPHRMIQWLKDDYEVDVLGSRPLEMNGLRSYVIGPAPNWSDHVRVLKKIKRTIGRNFNMLVGNYEEVNASRLGDVSTISEELMQREYDLIISHDLVLLPFLFKIKGNQTRVMLDAREYYPRHFNDRWLWRRLKRPVNEYLCREYLSRCDKVITVSDGLAEQYHRVYGVEPEVVMSLPIGFDLQPKPPEVDRIRIIHHGVAGKSRRNEVMLEVMDHVDSRFTLDLMMVARDKKYWQRLRLLAEKRPNVRVIPPVPMPEIVPMTNQYDIGLFLVPPTNFNLAHTLPNKLFEFIQARLAVAIGPSVDMMRIVQKYNCGIVAKDFDSRSLAAELNRLDTEMLVQFKQQSHEAAKVLNAETTGRRVTEIVRQLVEA